VIKLRAPGEKKKKWYSGVKRGVSKKSGTRGALSTLKGEGYSLLPGEGGEREKSTSAMGEAVRKKGG